MKARFASISIAWKPLFAKKPGRWQNGPSCYGIGASFGLRAMSALRTLGQNCGFLWTTGFGGVDKARLRFQHNHLGTVSKWLCDYKSERAP